MTLRLRVPTVEKLRTPVTSTGDPTGTLPDWAFTVGDVDPSVWTAGEWAGVWVDARSLVSAVSPTVGAAGAQVVLAAGTYTVWLRVTVGSEVAVRRVDAVCVT